MIYYLSIFTFVVSFSFNSFALNIPIEAAPYIDVVGVAEIKTLTESLETNEYSFDVSSRGLKLNLKGAKALEIMGYAKNSYVEPLWGLQEGRQTFDIYETMD